MKLKLKVFLIFEYTVSLFFFIYLYIFHRQPVNIQDLIFFFIVLFILSNISMFVNASNKIITSINLPILIPAVLILGPFWASCVAALGTIKINKLRDDFIWYKFVFNRGMLFMAAGCAGLAFISAQNFFSFPYAILSLLMATIAYFLVNSIFICSVIVIEGKAKDFSVPLYFLELSKNVFISYIIGIFFCLIYFEIGREFFILGIVLIFLVKDLLYTKLQQLNYYTQMVETFLKVIDSKDHYTEGHCKRVAKYTKKLCKDLGVSLKASNHITQMAKIHDIGKIKVNDEILKCKGELTDEQYEEIKKHSKYGREILSEIELLNSDLEIIRHHHERYDGKGYPDGIAGEEIPIGARILAVCDAFDVMTKGRVYKPAMGKEEIITELKECSGRQFDPEIAAVLIKLVKQGEFDDLFKEDNSECQTCDLAVENS